MYSSHLITAEVQRSPSFDAIMSEITAGMNFEVNPDEFAEYCSKFLQIVSSVGGPCAKWAQALKRDWTEACRVDLGLDLNFVLT